VRPHQRVRPHRRVRQQEQEADVVEAVEAEGDDEEGLTQKLYNESDYVLFSNMSGLCFIF
jgi:hypothetical protein